MQFLRTESLREYVQKYPVTAGFVLLLVVIHIGVELLGFFTGMPSEVFKLQYGAFYAGAPYWRYVASGLFHADFVHLLFNAFYLYVFSPPLEALLKRKWFPLLLVGSVWMGNVFTLLWNREELFYTLGASGAVYGLFGAYVVHMWIDRSFWDAGSRQTIWALFLIGLLLSVFIPQVNLSAHIGGAIGGALCMLGVQYARGWRWR